ncbi:pyridoxamine 5'-phosphate oxidase family protein, partial [Chloroflexota bacterium]
NNYVYEEAENAIFIHRSRVGRTSANLAENPRVCYSVSEMGQLYTGASAQNFGVEYRSVVIFGTATLVDDQAEARRVLQLFMDKYAPHLKSGVDYTPFTPEDAAHTAVYKIAIEQWSGKKRERPADQLAYDFPPDEA